MDNVNSKINSDDYIIEMIYHIGFYMVPLNAVGIYHDKRIWMENIRYNFIYDINLNIVDIEGEYNIYIIDDNSMSEIDRYMNKFSEMVGYHCWHIPDKYNKYNGKNLDKWYEMEYKFPNIENKKLILSNIKSNQIKYFTRP